MAKIGFLGAGNMGGAIVSGIVTNGGRVLGVTAKGSDLKEARANAYNAKIVRVMPNLPLKVGAGMTVVSRCDAVDDTELARAKALFDCVGETVVLPESYIDKSLAVNGSSPAYVCMFIEALADGAVKNGVDRKSAYLLAEQSVLGTAKLLLETGLHPAELKDMVCSPAGTTIEAVAALEQSGFRNAVLDAVEACTKKAMEMSGK